MSLRQPVVSNLGDRKGDLKMKLIFLNASVALAFLLGAAQALPYNSNEVNNQTLLESTYANPVIDIISADPSVFKLNGFYYLTIARSDTIVIFKSPILTNFRNAESRTVYTAPPGRANLWAPELHSVRGNLYIYFTMDDGVADQNHRMYVIKAADPNNPLGQWGSEKR